MNRILRTLVLSCLLLVLAACAAAGGQRSPRDQTLYHYVSAVRWSDFDAAYEFLEPERRSGNPLTDAERERYRQFQVSGYEVKSAREPADGEYEQVVEIRVVNRNTQVEKLITDRQRWRWDAEAKRWWLASGLPDLDAAR
ncbi:hypothetical protein [Arenimonas caeni]|jgi:hypothetical protein|uniref:hypothetical protein n=1 Tax=Arenimonas caeni TaxID=2058085 RepID=UPI002A36AE57|nr:hypothetical protein [Arenimonas caeni]MDY0021865.1 hypothetical protein [Arenimonas caeni]